MKKYRKSIKSVNFNVSRPRWHLNGKKMIDTIMLLITFSLISRPWWLLIVKENDSSELSKAIHFILDNENIRIKMGDSSRLKFKEKFYLPNKIKEHEELYDYLLGDS